jgi:3',5'-cyclic-AMP phosphodiesterase
VKARTRQVAGPPGLADPCHQRRLAGQQSCLAREQICAARKAAAADRGVRLALFTHKPLFHLSRGDAEIGGRFLNPRPRAELLAALGEVTPALIGSGHVHQFVSKEGLAGAKSRQIWAPATSFVLPTRQPHYGLRLTGYVEHVLKPDGGHFSRFVPVPGLECPSLADYPEAYAQYLEAGPCS